MQNNNQKSCTKFKCYNCNVMFSSDTIKLMRTKTNSEVIMCENCEAVIALISNKRKAADYVFMMFKCHSQQEYT